MNERYLMENLYANDLNLICQCGSIDEIHVSFLLLHEIRVQYSTLVCIVIRIYWTVKSCLLSTNSKEKNPFFSLFINHKHLALTSLLNWPFFFVTLYAINVEFLHAYGRKYFLK